MKRLILLVLWPGLALAQPNDAAFQDAFRLCVQKMTDNGGAMPQEWEAACRPIQQEWDRRAKLGTSPAQLEQAKKDREKIEAVTKALKK